MFPWENCWSVARRLTQQDQYEQSEPSRSHTATILMQFHCSMLAAYILAGAHHTQQQPCGHRCETLLWNLWLRVHSRFWY